MDIDLGTCRFSVPDDALMVPVQLMIRGAKDSVEALKLGPTMKVSLPQTFSRLLQLSIEEIQEGHTEQQGLDQACSIVIVAYRGMDPRPTEYPVDSGIARILSFKWRGPNSVPVRTLALFHVNGIVCRSVILSALDAPHVNPQVDGQFAKIIASITPAPRIVP